MREAHTPRIRTNELCEAKRHGGPKKKEVHFCPDRRFHPIRNRCPNRKMHSLLVKVGMMGVVARLEEMTRPIEIVKDESTAVPAK